MELSKRLYSEWRDLIDNRSDPRVKDWFLMETPVNTILLIGAYVYFVKVLGPKWMENRKPFKLKKLIAFYNIFQVVISIYMFYESCRVWIFGGYNWRCEPVDYSNSPQAMQVAFNCWVYFISKFIEFFDTIFFVLRKKDQNISLLHVVHHSIMPFSSYFGVKFVPGGSGTFFGFLNTFVHIIMYSYYLLAGLGPEYQKYLWWKKYLTVMQLTQFAAVFIHTIQLLFSDCSFPRIYVWAILGHSVLFIALFTDFYVKAYNKKRDDKIKYKAK